jgi:predicted HicB family RNase H-like nuclease
MKTLKLSAELHRKLKVKAAQEGTTIFTLIQKIIKKYLESK